MDETGWKRTKSCQAEAPAAPTRGSLLDKCLTGDDLVTTLGDDLVCVSRDVYARLWLSCVSSLASHQATLAAAQTSQRQWSPHANPQDNVFHR